MTPVENETLSFEFPLPSNVGNPQYAGNRRRVLRGKNVRGQPNPARSPRVRSRELGKLKGGAVRSDPDLVDTELKAIRVIYLFIVL